MNYETFEGYLSGKSQQTVKAYRKALENFATWFEAQNSRELQPADVTPTDVRQYRAWMVERHLAPATINIRLAAIRAYATCHKLELGQVRGVAEQEAAPRWLDRTAQGKLERELEREINAARTPAGKRQATRDKAIIALLIGAGLRIGELCDLEPSDLEIGERSGRVIVRQGKGDKRRVVPLNADVRQALRTWLCCITPDAPRLFINQRREPLTQAGVRALLCEYARRADLEVTPHQLRHTFAHNLVAAGVPLDHVAQLMGHENISTTMRYTLPDEKDLARDVAKLEA